MKDELIEILRSVPITDKTYPEYIEAVAERLIEADVCKASEVAEKIFAVVDKRFEALLKFYPCNGEFEDAKRFVDFHWKHIKHSIMCDYDADLKNKYTGEK